MLTVGLTGGIGSGKSTVAELFAKLGASIIDTDVIAHAMTATGQPALSEIAAAFGTGILQPDGSLNRSRLRQLIFEKPDQKQVLEAILHPRIREAVKAQLAEPADGPYRMIVVPLLFETAGYNELTQRSLLVDCPESLQIERVMARSRLSADEVRAIIATQMPSADRRMRADDIIVNDSTLESLLKRVTEKHEKYISLA